MPSADLFDDVVDSDVVGGFEFGEGVRLDLLPGAGLEDVEEEVFGGVGLHQQLQVLVVGEQVEAVVFEVGAAEGKRVRQDGYLLCLLVFLLIFQEISRQNIAVIDLHAQTV